MFFFVIQLDSNTLGSAVETFVEASESISTPGTLNFAVELFDQFSKVTLLDIGLTETEVQVRDLII